MSTFDPYDEGEDSAPWLGKWKPFVSVIKAALARKDPDASGHASFDKAERKHFKKLKKQIKRNRSTFWTNCHRARSLFYAYGCNITFFIWPAVPAKDWRDPDKQRALRIGLAKAVAEQQAHVCGRAGFVMRVHPAIFDPDPGKIPLHIHAWLLPFRIPENYLRALRASPNEAREALRNIAREGENMPGEGGPVMRWLASRHIGEADWSKLLTFCRGAWQKVQERVFGVKIPSSDVFGLVRVREDEERTPTPRRVRMISNDLDPLRRKSLDLARITTYIEKGASLTARMILDFDRKAGKVAVEFRHNGSGIYTPLEFCRRFLPPRPSAKGTTSGLLNGRDGDHPAMRRLFGAVFGEMVERDNWLLHWATLSPGVIRRMLTPEDALRLREEADEALDAMGRGHPHPRPSPNQKLWDRYHRFFSGKYEVILYYLQYMAEQALQRKPRKRAKALPPMYFPTRYPIRHIKCAAECDLAFLEWYGEHRPGDAAEKLMRKQWELPE